MRAVFTVLILLAPGAVHGQGIYQTPERFLDEVFDGTVPRPAVLWLTGPVREGYERLTGTRPTQLRLRYWLRGERSAWVLNAIGKEEPITAGFVVAGDRLERVKVLAFRERRGGEVRYPFFTDQFRTAGLNENGQLDRSIDSITGATLSVRAMERMARLALFLHAQVSPP